MTDSYRVLRWALVAGFVATAFVAIPGIFLPAPVAEFLGARLPTSPIWPAFGFLLTFLTSWFFLAAAHDPTGNLGTVKLSVAARFIAAAFWSIGYSCIESGPIPWWWLVEFSIGVIQLALLLWAERDQPLPAEG